MKLTSRTWVVLSLCTLLSSGGYAFAPVEDESDHFALFEDQATQSSDSSVHSAADPALETPLAKEDQPEATAAQIPALLGKIQDLEQSVQTLREQLETQTKELRSLQSQQLAFYKDLDARLNTPKDHPSTAPLDVETAPARPEQAASASPLTPQVGHETSRNPADEQISYLAAYDLIQQKRFDAALTAMQGFVVRYPEGGYTANAYYWLGELYLQHQQYPEAKQAFQTVLTQFSSSNKCAASLLKLGYTLAAEGQRDAAREQLQAVLKRYPDTPTAQLASTKLATLK